MKKFCDYCKKEISFEKHQQWAAHRSNCKFRPNINEKSEKIKEYQKSRIKKFIINCKKCNKEIELNLTESAYKKGDHKKYCSRKCANGHVVSEETRLKISNSVKNSEKSRIEIQRRKLLSIEKKKNIIKVEKICKGCGKSYIIEENKRQNFCSLKCCYNNPEKIKRISDNVKLQYKNGKKVYGGKTKWYSIETSNGIIRVQGTYEVRTCKILDKLKEDNSIKNWEYTNDRFEYINSENNKSTYLLDFKVFDNNNNFYYIEVKGYKRINDELKWESVRNNGLELKIWFNDDLKEYEKKLNIINIPS